MSTMQSEARRRSNPARYSPAAEMETRRAPDSSEHGSVRALGAYASRDDCPCPGCRRLRRIDRMEPLTWGDKLWIGAVSLAWVAVFGYAIAVAVSS
jgi:hypothetical protein